MKQNINKQFGKALNLLRDVCARDENGEISESKVAKLFAELVNEDGYPSYLPHFDLSRCPENMTFEQYADFAMSKQKFT